MGKQKLQEYSDQLRTEHEVPFGKCRKVVLPSTGVEVYKTGGLILFHLLLERKRGLLLLDNPELLDQTR